MRRSSGFLGVLLSLLVFVAAPVEATRTLPSLADSYRTQAPIELLTRLEADAAAQESSFYLFREADLSFPPRVLELEEFPGPPSCNYDVGILGYDEGGSDSDASHSFDLKLSAPAGAQLESHSHQKAQVLKPGRPTPGAGRSSRTSRRKR